MLMVHLRIVNRMKEGIMIAGRLYEFLAYSQSSLREATVWFMTPFEHDGKTITAERIRISLGNFECVEIPLFSDSRAKR